VNFYICTHIYFSGWNAILNALDFFASKNYGYDVFFDFPIPYMAANFMFGVIMP